MNLSIPSDLSFFGERAGRGVADQALHERLQINAVIEAVGGGAEVVVGVLAELERLLAPANHGLEVAQDGVDPGELRRVARLALANDDKRMRATCVDDTGKATPAVAASIAARAVKPIRPAHRSERRSVLVSAPLAGGELWQRNLRLKLDSIHRHG